MLKLIGAGTILGGTIGVLLCWCNTNRIKLLNIRSIIEMLQRAEYMCVNEKINNKSFFLNIKCTSPCIQQICHMVGENMAMHIYPSGMQIWREAIEKNRQDLVFSLEETELFIEAGNAFFSRTLDEKRNRIVSYRKQFEELYCRQKEIIAERKKIYMPLGAMSGIMLVIIFV